MSDSVTPPAAPLDPEVEGLLVDRFLGDLDDAGRRRLERLLGDGPAARREAAEDLVRFLGLARDALPEPVEAGQADRVVARVRARAEAEAARERREAHRPASPRRLLWARVLAVSVGLHVVLLGVLVAKARQAPEGDAPVRIRVELPSPGILPEADPLVEDVASPWIASPDELVLPETRLAEAAPEDVVGPEGLAPLGEERYAYAPSVSGPMHLRRHDALKRGRLQLLGFDADGTLRAVGRGLRALASRQAQDGSFAAGGGRSAAGETALALLPFLGEGHGSMTPGAFSRDVVAPGIAWIRRALVDGDADTIPAADLGIALKALSEDYMLSYGRLRPVEAERRAGELQALTQRVVAAQDASGRFPGADEDVRLAVWPMWGLEAAARSGAVLPPASVAERFRSWYGSRERTGSDEVAAGLLLARTLGDALGRAGVESSAREALARGHAAEEDAFVLATTGTGLLIHDPALFRTWSSGLDDKLIRSLLQTGVVREGDAIGDTATVLLALQVAYRTY